MSVLVSVQTDMLGKGATAADAMPASAAVASLLYISSEIARVVENEGRWPCRREDVEERRWTAGEE